MTIDWWTLGLQTVNVLILVYILGRFLFRPVAEIIDRRQQTAAVMLAEAEAARGKARAELADIASTRQGFKDERERIVQQAHSEAEADRRKLIADAQAELERAKAAAEAARQHDLAEAERAMTDKAGALALDIARRLLIAVPDGAVNLALIRDLPASYASLPEKRRELLRAAAVSSGLKVTTAEALDEQDRKTFEAALAQTFGSVASIDYSIDPGLVAGFEITGGDVVLRRNWRADLEHIRHDLGGSDGSPQTS